ncbi:ligase-associated DNA damage response endonuclease PdeM [Thalassorhabdomicrobium marinisediminis]|uniref:ligase-associated DNA damage response endonuclease PdeM n=1 Tax=Thalassorhabdomicrobium marinisediminis TaxID=2170577 RepID=UPI00249094D4|nr:ligase-associated DNA damage response endonuclease PdeM [Thalassorhabdomicrobium marinisediminis]
MNDHAFTFNDAALVARADGTLWWPQERLLCVSDLHLGKSERIARKGGNLLPPYETQDTLWRLEAAIAAVQPERVICLGDSFDDITAAQSVPDEARRSLMHLQAGREWIWIEGNHDPGPVDIGGTHRDEVTVGPLTFRHITDGKTIGEVSGHYHPKASVRGAGFARACFLMDRRKLILPAFGAYTGGLSVGHTALRSLFAAEGLAILTGKRALPVPLSACLRR